MPHHNSHHALGLTHRIGINSSPIGSVIYSNLNVAVVASPLTNIVSQHYVISPGLPSMAHDLCSNAQISPILMGRIHYACGPHVWPLCLAVPSGALQCLAVPLQSLAALCGAARYFITCLKSYCRAATCRNMPQGEADDFKDKSTGAARSGGMWHKTSASHAARHHNGTAMAPQP